MNIIGLMHRLYEDTSAKHNNVKLVRLEVDAGTSSSLLNLGIVTDKRYYSFTIDESDLADSDYLVAFLLDAIRKDLEPT